MYERSDKRYIYNLINDYLESKIDEVALCDGMYSSYVHEIDETTLNDAESEVFSELEMVTKRFSEFDSDHKLDPKAFTTKEEVKKAVIEAKKKLQERCPNIL